MRRIRLFVTLIIMLAAGAPEASAVVCMLMRSTMMAMDAGATPETTVAEQHTVGQCPLSRCVSPIVARLADPPTTAIALVPHQLAMRPDASRLIRSAEAPPLPPPRLRLSLI